MQRHSLVHRLIGIKVMEESSLSLMKVVCSELGCVCGNRNKLRKEGTQTFFSRDPEPTQGPMPLIRTHLKGKSRHKP